MALRALDSILFNFARWRVVDASVLEDETKLPLELTRHRESVVGMEPGWLVSGSKVFENTPDMLRSLHCNGLKAIQGYYSALKSCAAGLVMVSDLAVSAFLESGEMINLMMVTDFLNYEINICFSLQK